MYGSGHTGQYVTPLPTPPPFQTWMLGELSGRVWTMKAKKSIRFNYLVDVSGRWWTLIRLTILPPDSQ